MMQASSSPCLTDLLQLPLSRTGCLDHQGSYTAAVSNALVCMSFHAQLGSRHHTLSLSWYQGQCYFLIVLPINTYVLKNSTTLC